MADGGVARGRVFRGAVEPLASYRQVILLYGPIKHMHPFAGLAHPASDFEASIASTVCPSDPDVSRCGRDADRLGAAWMEILT